MAKWHSTKETPTSGVIWIRRELSGIELGEYHNGTYANYGASADREGLGIETFTDVTHWAEAEPPPFDYKESE